MSLFHAVARGNLTAVKRQIQQGADLNARDYNDCASIHIAAAKNHSNVVSYLIELGADINGKDAFGRTPLDVAVSSQHGFVASILRKTGAKHSLAPCPRRCSSESFLKGHFPETIASAMMQSFPVLPTCKESVSILFSDVLDYSALRGTLEPLVLCNLLERLFHKFDLLAQRHGVQRIDAIDGCYIVAANFSFPQANDHAVRLARFALDAMAAASATPIDEERAELGTVRLLAGLHCGAVCGTMLGAHGGLKYTVVGDAVNVASRMMSHGAAGAVQCSGAFAAALAAQGGGCDELVLRAREGDVDVKGRGRMEAWWLGRAGKKLPITACGAAEGPSGPSCGSYQRAMECCPSPHAKEQ